MKTIKQFPEGFEPLVNEHVAAIQFIERIRGRNLGVTHYQLEKYVNWFYKYHMRPHISLEDRILRQFIPLDHALRNRIEDDHDEIFELKLALNDEFDPGVLELFCNRIEKHIQFEEKEFFPFLQSHLSEEEFFQVEHLIASSQKEIPEWPEPFWD